jgi:hypothetical protein
MSIETSTQIPRVRQSFSLCLPKVSIYFNPAVLNDSALSLYGVINRTDLVLTWTSKGEPYFQAFIHYHGWHNTPEVALFQEDVSNKSIHVVLSHDIGTVYENTSPERFFLSSLEVQHFHTPEVDANFEEFWDETVLNGYLIDTLTQSNAEEYCEFIEFIEQQNEMETESEHQERINLWTPEEAGVLEVIDEDNNGKCNGKYDINWYPGYTPMSSSSNHVDTDLKWDPLNLNEMSDEQYCIIDPKDIADDPRPHSAYGPIIIGNDNDTETDWHRTLQKLTVFMDNHGRRPRIRQTETGTVSPKEIKLGNWVIIQIHNFSEDRAKCKQSMKTESCWSAWNYLRQHSIYGPLLSYKRNPDAVALKCLDDYVPNRSKMTLDELAC